MHLRHEAILASAGSGKTHQLSNRVVQLLAAGAEPATIVALTFTRKAAGEFTRRVISKLAAAAGSAAAARALANELALDAAGWPAPRFAALLAHTLRNLHRLRFSTFDGFFQTLVRAALWELGVTSAFTLLDERLSVADRARVLRRIFRRDTVENPVHADFLAAFRLATWGREERGVTELMGNFINAAAAHLREFPGQEAWGDEHAIFGPGGSPWLRFDTTILAAALVPIREAAADIEKENKRLATSFRKFCEVAADWAPGLPWKGNDFFEDKLLPAVHNFIAGGDATFEYYKKPVTLPKPLAAVVTVVATCIVGGILERHLKVTRGVYSLLRKYDDIYDRLVRRAGRLTFADTEELLSRRLPETAFRLDATAHHWLFDEFQDTSRRQWAILADNLHEVLAGDAAERSAFFVGDVKQALYGWRGGSHHILTGVRDQYAGNLVERRLDVSWRSAPGALAFANAVFGNLAAAQDALPTGTFAAWAAAWGTHDAAPRTAHRPGWSAWFVCPRPTAGRATSDEAIRERLQLALALLREARPLARGLTCGLLTQTNDEARTAAAFLRENGVRASSETDLPVCEDNPVTLALLALLAHAAHPADGFSAGVVAGFPALAAWVAHTGGQAAARQFLLTAIAEDGFETTLKTVANALGDALPADAFSARRLGQLFAVAREFDASGGRDVDDFTLFARESRKRDTSAADTVQIMTIHKSKGLEFDMVLLPFLEGGRVDSVRTEGFISHSGGNGGGFGADADGMGGGGGNGWVLSNPGNLVCENTRVLDAHLRRRRDDAAYEELCKLYVALTRAKSAVCAITTAGGDRAADSGLNFPTLLEVVLGNRDDDSGNGSGERAKGEPKTHSVHPVHSVHAVHSVHPVHNVHTVHPTDTRDAELQPEPPSPTWSSGQRDWFANTPLLPTATTATETTAAATATTTATAAATAFTPPVAGASCPSSPAATFAPRKIWERRRPSDTGNLRISAASLFAETTAAARGREVHALLAQIAFVDFETPTAADIPPAIADVVRAPALRAVFAAPEPGARLWREKAFDIILDGAWVSGVFDRVVLGANDVWIWDFKTDADATPSVLREHHSPQLLLYRRALAMLTAVPPARIHAAIVHTPTQTIVEL
jgi:ATP-dependent exoDNAse (exonuclease V) beta subunit